MKSLSYSTIVLMLMISIVAASCGGGDEQNSAGQSSSGANKSGRGGTIIIGDQSWEFVPSLQCGIYAGNLVTLSGHSATDSETEIVVDYDVNSKLKGIRIGPERGDQTWKAVGSTIAAEIKGNKFSGTAGFRRGYAEVVVGEFKFEC